VATTTPGDIDLDRFQTWLHELLHLKGNDIFRMKGVLSVRDAEERYIFQGVHMLVEGRDGRPWGSEPRRNALVFIGRDLDRAQLVEGSRLASRSARARAINA
jgi:G3E family GTPase